MQPTEVELAYTAGMIDGEGHIGLTTTKSSFLPTLVVTNTDERITDWLREHFGGAVYHHLRTNGIHKPRHNWRLLGRHATELLALLQPYLVLKREQAQLAISYYAGHSSYHWGNRRLPTAEYQRRKELHEHLKRLNRRGLG
jgi:hypothetical protein